MATVNDISSYAEEDAHCIRKLYHIFLSFFSSVYSPSGRRGARIQAPSLRGRPRLLSRRPRGARGRRLRVSDSPARRPSTCSDPNRSACAPVFGRVDARGGVRRYYRYSLQVCIRLLWTSRKLCTLLGLPWTPTGLLGVKCVLGTSTVDVQAVYPASGGIQAPPFVPRPSNRSVWLDVGRWT